MYLYQELLRIDLCCEIIDISGKSVKNVTSSINSYQFEGHILIFKI